MKRLFGRTFGILLPIALAATAFAGSATAEAKGGKCSAFKPTGKGAGKPVTVVTDAATSKKPVKVSLTTPPGLGFSSSTPDAGPGSGDTGPVGHSYANVQVVSKAKTAKLFVRIEFQQPEDYDLYLRTDDGTAPAYAGGANEYPVPAGGLDGTGHGGHSEQGAEQIDGFSSATCAGYTVDVVSATTPGGTVTVKYWLGK